MMPCRTILFVLSCFALFSPCIPAPQGPCNIEYKLNVQNVTCKGGSDGAVNIVISKGAGPFIYTWLPTTITSQNASGLSAGSYTMNITNNINCSVSQTVQIYEPQIGITITNIETPISCLSKQDGMLFVSASGGTGPYIFNLSTGEQSPVVTNYTFRNLKFAARASPFIPLYDDAIQQPFQDYSWAHNYTKTYTDLTHSGKYSISMYPNAYAGIDFHCEQHFVHGCIDLDLYAGVSFWLNGVTGGQFMQAAIDDNAKNGFHIENLENLPANQWINKFYNFSTTDYPFPMAYGFRILGGSGTTGIEMVLIDDVYAVPKIAEDQYITVVDSKGCTARQPYGISVSPAMVINVSVINPACNGDLGTLQASVQNGFPPYSYLWMPTYGLSQTLRARATVQYDIEYIFNDTLINFGDLSTTSVISYSSDVAYRGSTSVKYTPSSTGIILWYKKFGINKGQYLGLEFWVYSNMNVTQIIDFALATYDEEVAQTSNYARVNFRTLTGLDVIPADKWVKAFYNFSNLTANVFYNAIYIKALADIGPVYLDEVRLISAANTNYDVSRVDYYSVIVTDANSCSARLDYITIGEPDAFSVDVQASHISCKNYQDGNLSAVAKGGTRPYCYNWTVSGVSGAGDLPTVSGLGVVSGYVEVTDANLCTAVSKTVVMREPPPMTYLSEKRPVSCFGRPDGVSNLTVQGGTPPYSLSFSSSNFESNYISLMPVYIYYDSLSYKFVNSSILGNIQEDSVAAHSGYYSISFSNYKLIAFHCSSCISNSKYKSITFYVYVPPQTGSFRMSLTYGVQSGSSQISPADPPAQQLILETALGVWVQATYDLDMNSTNAWSTFFILASSTTHPMITIYVDTVQLIPRWYSNEPQASGLPSGFQATFVGKAGSYNIDIEDSNGCSLTANLFNAEPAALELAEMEADPPTLNKKRDGKIKVKVTGGTPPYEYLWAQPGGFEENAVGLGAGIYNVTVRDVIGCSAHLSITLGTGTALVGDKAALKVVLSLVVGLCMLVGLFAMGLLTVKPTYYQEKSPLFCKIIHIGVLVGYIAAATAIPSPTDSLCVAFPWLVGASFTLVYGCLFLKTWRIYSIVRASKKMQKVTLTNLYIIKLLSIYSIVEFVYLIVWTIVDPPQAKLTNAMNDGGKMVQCVSKYYGIFWSVSLGYKSLWVIFGVVMAIGSRNMIARYNESKEIYYCIYNMIIFSVICLPLQGYLHDTPYAQVTIQVALLLVIFTFTLVALYFSVWMKVFFGDDDFGLANIRHKTGPLSRDADPPGRSISAVATMGSIEMPTRAIEIPLSFSSGNTPDSPMPLTSDLLSSNGTPL